MSLLSFPKYQLMEFLGSWCRWKEITKLDSAVCTGKSRDNFLEIIRNVSSMELPHLVNNAWFIIWLNTRKIKLTSPCLGELCLPVISALDKSRLTSLTIADATTRSSRHILLRFINSCQLLTSLTLKKVDCLMGSYFLRIDKQIMSQLKHLLVVAIKPDRDVVEHAKSNV